MALTGLPKYIDEYPVPTPNSAPLAIVIDQRGMVWFTESNSSKIGRFDPADASFHEFIVPGVGDMWGLAVDRGGGIWFTQYSGKGSVNPGGMVTGGGHGRLVHLDPSNGSFSFVDIPTVGSFPLRLAIDAQSRVWFTELLGSKIGVYDPSSSNLIEYPVPTNMSGPADLAFDRNGMLWFTETYASKIASFDPKNGLFKEYQLDTQNPADVISSPVGIALAAEGSIWIADHGGNWIGQFQPTTGTLSKYPTHVPPADVYPISIPNGLLIDQHGQVWFSEHGGNSIGYYDPDRRIMLEYRIPTGPVSTSLWIALAPNGNIWFTEWMMNQIGVVHANLPIPLSLTVSETQLTLRHNAGTALTMTLAPSQEIGGNGTVTYSLSAYNQQDIALQASPHYPQLDSNVQIQIQLTPSNRMVPGNYTVGLEVDLGQIIISQMIGVTVASSQNSAEYGIPRVAIFWAGIVILLVVVVAIAVRRLSRKLGV